MSKKALMALEGFASQQTNWIENRFPEPVDPAEAKARLQDNRPLPLRKLIDEKTGRALPGDNTQNIPYMEYHLWSMEKVRPYRQELLNIAQTTQEIGSSRDEIIRAEAVQDVLASMKDTITVAGPMSDASKAAVDVALEGLCRSIGYRKGSKRIVTMESMSDTRFHDTLVRIYEQIKRAIGVMLESIRNLYREIVESLKTVFKKTEIVKKQIATLRQLHGSRLKLASQQVLKLQHENGLFVQEILVEEIDTSQLATSLENKGLNYVPAIRSKSLAHYFRGVNGNKRTWKDVIHCAESLKRIEDATASIVHNETRSDSPILSTFEILNGTSSEEVKKRIFQETTGFFSKISSIVSGGGVVFKAGTPALIPFPFDQYVEVYGDTDCNFNCVAKPYPDEVGEAVVQICPEDFIDQAYDLIVSNTHQFELFATQFEKSIQDFERAFAQEYASANDYFGTYTDAELDEKYAKLGGADGMREKLKDQTYSMRAARSGMVALAQYSTIMMNYGRKFNEHMLDWISQSLNVLDKVASAEHKETRTIQPA